MKRKLTVIAVLFAFLYACSPVNSDSSSSSSSVAQTTALPQSIGVSVPDTLVDSSAQTFISPLITRDTNTGTVYPLLRDFTTMGVRTTEMIDQILSNVNLYKDSLESNKGTVLNLGQNGWILYDDLNSQSKYLYYGDSNSVTNLYIDWQSNTNGNFQGNALWFGFANSSNPEQKEVRVIFDTSENAYVDLYLLPNTNHTGWDGMESIRVKITSETDGVTVQASATSTNSYTNSMNSPNFKYWNLTGWANTNGEGGVQASADGYLTNVITNNSIPFLLEASNYSFQEYFGTTGLITYSLEQANMTMSASAISYLSNMIYIGDNLMTNTPPPSTIQARVTNIPKLGNSEYRRPTLP